MNIIQLLMIKKTIFEEFLFLLLFFLKCRLFSFLSTNSLLSNPILKWNRFNSLLCATYHKRQSMRLTFVEKNKKKLKIFQISKVQMNCRCQNLKNCAQLTSNFCCRSMNFLIPEKKNLLRLFFHFQNRQNKIYEHYHSYSSEFCFVLFYTIFFSVFGSLLST